MSLKSLKETIDRTSYEYYSKSESCPSFFESLDKQINQLLDPDFPSKDRQTHALQSLKFNKILVEEKDNNRLIFKLYEAITSKELTQADDLNILPTLFNDSNVYTIYNLLYICGKLDELKLKSFQLLFELREWLLTPLPPLPSQPTQTTPPTPQATRRSQFLHLYRKLTIFLLHEAVELLENEGNQEKYLPQIARLMEALEEEGNQSSTSPELMKTFYYEIALCKIKLAIYVKNIPQATQMISENLKIFTESLQDLANEKSLPNNNDNDTNDESEQPIVIKKNNNTMNHKRYHQLLLLQIKLLSLQGNFIEATKLLNNERWDEYSKLIILHDLGNLLFHNHKYQTSYLHYEKSLQSILTNPTSLTPLLHAKQTSKILLTIGLVLMKQLLYFDSFYCISLSCLLYPNLLAYKDTILLRLGESCIQYDRLYIQEKQKLPNLNRFPISIHTLPSSTRQRLLLKFGVTDSTTPSSSGGVSEYDLSAKEYENLIAKVFPIAEVDRNAFINALMNCSLNSAVILLQRALTNLLRKDEKVKAANPKYLPTVKAVLMNLAYVHLRLKDYRLAVYYGNQHILAGGKKSAVVANIVAEGLFYMKRYEECDKVLRAAIQEQSMTIDADSTPSSYSQYFLSDNYMLSSQYLQCKSPNELEKIGLMSNALTMSLIMKENLDLTVVEQLLKQYPRLTPVWKTLLFTHLKRRNPEDLKVLVKSYVQKTK